MHVLLYLSWYIVSNVLLIKIVSQLSIIPGLSSILGVPEMGEYDVWDCVSPDNHSAVFEIFTEESKLIGERCRSGKATTKG